MARRWWAVVATTVLVVTTAGCVDGGASQLPARVGQLPEQVRGLGPAVFAVAVADERRTDLTGLVAVERFGDEIAGVAPDRRHAEIALGDPRFPTVADGLAEDRRAALLTDGRIIDVALPDHVYLRTATGVGPQLSITGPRCLIVRPDGTVEQPAVEAACVVAEHGGVIWQERPGDRFGGVDLTTGAVSPAISLPTYPFAAAPDGRLLAALTDERPARLIIADTADGSWRPTVEVARTFVSGVFTDAGFAVTHLRDGLRAVSVVQPDGVVRTLLSPVGDVTFAPAGRYALVEETGSGARRLAVLDLTSGSVVPVTEAPEPAGASPAGTSPTAPAGDAGRPGPTDLPPVAGSLAVAVAGEAALVVELPYDADVRRDADLPNRVWSVDLASATARPGPDLRGVSSATVLPSTGASLAALRLGPSGDAMTIDTAGTVTTAGSLATPRTAFPDGTVLHDLHDEDGELRVDRVLLTDGAGHRTEIATGGGSGQRVGGVLATPDGAYLLVSLRSDRGGSRPPGPEDALVLVRRDGTGEPLVLYQGAVLVSLGLTTE
ncbi:hypothetical protein O7608_10115 [Solwaraspora sp. WMMA2056]|uniref:hypothetical protein n=1 Tax=Solwaraspora sp. WMMA2056 TaxID=3015161 RepID=UPI00259BB8A8|nr:hypothetical protein [Solwaraspora sp. WMMA2056]WJK42695.1 hypothetical protein O7608_10115 [Solwaraspora sp. WMMA2056]